MVAGTMIEAEWVDVEGGFKIHAQSRREKTGLGSLDGGQE